MNTLERFLAQKEDGVFLIGHASALVRTGAYLTLFDPVWGDYSPYGEFWHFWPGQMNLDHVLDHVDRVVISHEHADHLCEEILRKVRCTVHIMSGRQRLRERIQACGRTVVEHDPRTWRWFTPESEIFFLEHPFNAVDSFPVIRSKHMTVSLGSDCFLDVKQVEVLKRAVDRIDVALVPWAFIHWWPFLQENLDESRREELIQREVAKCCAQADLFVSEMKPTVAFSTGADLYYNAPTCHVLNRHLFENPLPDEVRKGLPGWFVTMEFGKVIEDFHPSIVPPSEWPKRPFPELHIEPARPGAAQIRRLEDKLSLSALFPSELDIVVNDLPINADRRTWGTVRVGKHPFYHFQFDATILEQWLDGKLTFEQAIGTRRFRFRRKPEEHYDPAVYDWINRYL